MSAKNEAAVNAIKFAIDPNTESPLEFLKLWDECDFDAIEKKWPHAPEGVYEGVDHFYPRRNIGIESDGSDE